MRVSRHRLWLASATAVLTAFGVITAVSARAAAGCSVTYTVTGQWQGGFSADVTITDLGDPINAWRLTWTFTARQTISRIWDATLGTPGPEVSITNTGRNGSIPTGGTVGFGFNGTWNGSNPIPSDFALNGTTCIGTVSGSPTATPTPTPTPAGTA